MIIETKMHNRSERRLLLYIIRYATLVDHRVTVDIMFINN